MIQRLSALLGSGTATLAQRIAADAAGLVARVVIGQAFAQAGWGKLNDLARTTEVFSGLGIPGPGFHAVAIGGLEFVGGLLLIVGLGVRAVSVLLLSTMIVALLTAHRGDLAGALTFNPAKGLTDITAAMFALVLLPLIAHGGGRVGLDRLVWLGCQRRKPNAGA